MFGYIVPVKCELKVREFEAFRSVYCGLCHSLKDRYGFFSRFVLNYDFTFLAMLLSQSEDSVVSKKRRCLAKPVKKHCYYQGGAGFEKAAGFSLILSWYKLKDAVADGGFLEKIAYQSLLLFLRPAYHKARKDFPDFDKHAGEKLKELSKLEAQNSDELDLVADTFASLLSFGAKNTEQERIYHEIFYHTGRLIYLLDAYDDLAEDQKKGNYNPLGFRFTLVENKLSESDKAYLETSMQHSGNLVAAAYNLLPQGQFSGILDNIIYLGFPLVTQTVLQGNFRKIHKKRPSTREAVRLEEGE